MNEKKIKEIEDIIGYTFNNKKLLIQAFTHSSYAHEQNDMSLSYERLEFLGDAILEMMSSLYLFEQNKEEAEGQLTKERARLVCTYSLSNIILSLHLEKYILLGKGEKQIAINHKPSIMEDVLESLIGAIFLDGGYDNTWNFIIKNVMQQTNCQFIDYKSKLQEILQVDGDIDIKYEVIKESGPEHDKTFTCELYIANEPQTIGVGKSKKEASQQAAKAYLSLIK